MLNSTSITGSVSCDTLLPFWIQWTTNGISVSNMGVHDKTFTKMGLNLQNESTRRSLFYQIGTGTQPGAGDTVLAQYLSDSPVYEINSIALATGNDADGLWEFTFLQGFRLDYTLQ